MPKVTFSIPDQLHREVQARTRDPFNPSATRYGAVRSLILAALTEYFRNHPREDQK